MVAHLGLRTHELLYEEIGNIIADILSASEKAKCYEEVASHSQRIFTFILNDNFRFFYMLCHEYKNNPKGTLIMIGYLFVSFCFLGNNIAEEFMGANL